MFSGIVGAWARPARAAARPSRAVEVVEFIRGHLHKDKVVLLAGSMGTLLGLPLAKRRPDLFSALVCTDMYADLHENEAVAHQKTLDRVRQAGNTKAVAALEKIGSDPSTWDLKAWQLFIFQGATDVLTITELAQAYFEKVEAPHKEMALIEGASHFAAFTQPERFRVELVNRVLPVIQ